MSFNLCNYERRNKIENCLLPFVWKPLATKVFSRFFMLVSEKFSACLTLRTNNLPSSASNANAALTVSTFFIDTRVTYVRHVCMRIQVKVTSQLSLIFRKIGTKLLVGFLGYCDFMKRIDCGANDGDDKSITNRYNGEMVKTFHYIYSK